MRIEILKRGVMEEIYALSALQGYVELPERERSLLQEDQEEGLSVLVNDAFADVAMELMPRVADIGVPDEDNEGNMWIEFKEYNSDQKIMVPIMSQILTKGIAYKVLGAIYEGVEVGGSKTCSIGGNRIDRPESYFRLPIAWMAIVLIKNSPNDRKRLQILKRPEMSRIVSN